MTFAGDAGKRLAHHGVKWWSFPKSHSPPNLRGGDGLRGTMRGWINRPTLSSGNAMKKRTRWLVVLSGCGVVAVAAAAATVWWSATVVGINRNGYNLIREGMTLDEVSTILGKPPGDYRTRETKQTGIVQPDVEWWQHDHKCSSGKNWISDCGWIWVGFSEDGKAVGKHFHDIRPG